MEVDEAEQECVELPRVVGQLHDTAVQLGLLGVDRHALHVAVVVGFAVLHEEGVQVLQARHERLFDHDTAAIVEHPEELVIRIG